MMLCYTVLGWTMSAVYASDASVDAVAPDGIVGDVIMAVGSPPAVPATDNGMDDMISRLKKLMPLYYTEILVESVPEGLADVIEKGAEAYEGIKWEAQFVRLGTQIAEVIDRRLRSSLSRPSTALYEPAHRLMTVLRWGARAGDKMKSPIQLVGMRLVFSLSETMALHARTTPAVGYHLFYLGLADYLEVIDPSSPKHASAVMLMEQNILPLFVTIKAGAYLFRDWADDAKYPPDLLAIEKFIALPIPTETADRERAIEGVTAYVALVRSVWEAGLPATNAELKSSSKSEVARIISILQINV